MWRLRSVLVLVMLYYLWNALTINSGTFAGYTTAEIFTYVLWVNFMRSAIFGVQSREVADQINTGDFSRFLIAPVNYFWYEFFRELAERSINFVLSIAEVFLFILIIKPKLFIQTNSTTLLYFIIASILAVFLYYIISYLVSLIAFWSREAMGPRFLFEWILEFASGAYFPLSILSSGFFAFLHFLPFMYLLFLPVSLYLGKLNNLQITYLFMGQLFWLIFFSILLAYVWRTALKRYTGEGI
jgi:ABC-2 type transport system permease protein